MHPLAALLLLTSFGYVKGQDKESAGGIIHHYEPKEKNVISPRYQFNPCRVDETGVFELASADEKEIRFIYEVETGPEVNGVVLENVVLKQLERAIVEQLLKTSLFDEICNPDRQRLLNLSLRRKMPVVGITTSPKDEVIGLQCEIESLSNEDSCYVIDGAFMVLSDQPVDTETVIDHVRKMMNEEFRFDGYDAAGFVEKVRFRERRSNPLQNPEPRTSLPTAEADTVGLRSSAYAIMAVAAILVLGGAIVYRRRRRDQSSDDAGSQPTDLSAPQEDESQLADE